MDQPSKKRSLFGFSQFFRSSSAPTDDQNAMVNSPSKPAAPTPAPAQRDFGSAPSPHSPVKRASESQLAGRKIIGRPQGPSSKLSQSISASELAHRPSSTTVAPPRRMPGDNPNKPPSSLFASSVSHAPAANIPKSTSFSGVTSTPRNIFRSSALYSRPGGSTFSPRVSTDPLNQSFPPATPGRPARGSTADVNGRILANTAPTELFKMRIPSPPRHLTGEMLAKEVPEDPNRAGSIYADEFLAHYCPPDLDEHQRRQFFCILDLRRLKYAADEVFTKKDWKINIMNFAKEYEKSRSLIMLRYGLYEFKTVRASEAVKKEWKQKHGIPDSDDESEQVPRTNGAAKRKAEDELTPSSIALTASVSGANKRARAPELSAKNKRKADSEPDENQPAKLQKPTSSPQKTSSATKSVFESIANSAKAPDSAKPADSTNLFGSVTASKPNGAPARSVFDASSKPAAAAGNIFGHLSDESKGSGNEGADEASETDSEAGEDESEAHDLSQSDEAAASGGVATPQFADSKKALPNGTSSASSDAGENNQGRSIFERITRGSDGQPIRKVPPGDGALFAAPPPKDRSASPVKDQPTNNTWNANTPIKFSAPSGSLFASTAPKPASTSAIDFGASVSEKADKAEEAPSPAPAAAEAPKESAPQNIFAAQAKKADEPAKESEAAKAPATNLFSFPAKNADAPASASPLFGGMKTAASTSTPLFGSTTPAFGQQKDKEEPKSVDAPSAPAASTPAPLFGAQPAAATSEAPKPSIFQSSTLFGTQSKSEPAPATQPQSGGLFGKPQTIDTPVEKPASSLFSTGAAKPAGSLFGTAAATSEGPAAKKFAFGSSEDKSTTTSLFGSNASTPAPEPAKPTETKSIFGATPAAPTTETKSLFGSTTPAPAQETKSLFGGASAATETKPLFGSTPGAAESKPLFGGTPAATESKPLFGSTPATTEQKPLFGAASAATEQKPLFGSTPAATESKPLFGGTSATEQKPLFGSAPAATENKPSGLFGNASTTAPAASNTPIFNFGASQTPAAPQSTAPQPSGSIFGTGASASFTFSAGGSDGSTIKNPFSSDGSYSAPSSFDFGSGGQSSSTPFTFGAGSTPTISFGGTSDAGTQQGTSFGGPSSGSIFNFGGSSQPQNPPAGSSIFANSLAPGGGTSTGTNSPFTFGGASSLATTPAATTPEPSANAEDGKGTNADGDEAPQEQISLTEGGPGEEDESVVHEVRAKAVKLVTAADSEEEGADKDNNKDKNKDSKDSKKSPWKVMGVGPLRLLKHKTTGGVRMLLRAEPRGHIALNKAVLPNFTYKVEPGGGKYVKLTTATDDGKGLETWMLQVKTPDAAKALAEALEEHKKANEKKKEKE
ncbi:hypothetical protein VTK26DRAFT_6683 [Humicola hyalothermophila]